MYGVIYAVNVINEGMHSTKEQCVSSTSEFSLDSLVSSLGSSREELTYQPMVSQSKHRNDLTGAIMLMPRSGEY